MYPSDTLNTSTHYRSSFLNLVKDDNRLNASLYIPISEVSCEYKYNRFDYFFECQILGMQWDRQEDTLKLFFDARGEHDLRHPSNSSIAMAIHRKRPNRLRLRRIRAELYRQRNFLNETINNLQHGKDIDDSGLSSHHYRDAQRYQSSVRALNSIGHRILGVEQELYHHASLSAAFSDIISIQRPSNCCLYVDRPGHYKGYMEYSEFSALDVASLSLPPHHKELVEDTGFELLFCYANPVPAMPHSEMVDYYAVPLLTTSPGADLREAFRSNTAVYVSHEAPCESMNNEEPYLEEKRWSHVWFDMTTREQQRWSDYE